MLRLFRSLSYIRPLKCHTTVSQGDSLLERLSSDDSFRVLLGQGRPQEHPQVMTSVNMERPSAAPTPDFESMSFQPEQQLFQQEEFFLQGPAAADLQSLRATSERMRSVLKSIQPQKQPDSTKLLPASIQRKQPILPPAPLGNAQPSTSRSAVNALNAQPGPSKIASYAETAPTFQNPSLDRKRDAEGRLRKENNYQAGLSLANAWLSVQPCLSSVYPLILCYRACTSKSIQER